jgi:hypothetical protein
MAIKQETRLHWTAVFDGMNFDSISVFRDPDWRFLPPIDLNPSNLRVRHPQRLSQMFDALPFPEVNRNRPSLLMLWQKVVQPAME